MMRIEEICLQLEDDESILPIKIGEAIGVDPTKIISWTIVKKAIDSRKKYNIQFVYSIDFELDGIEDFWSHVDLLPIEIKSNIGKFRVKEYDPFVYEIKNVEHSKVKNRPVVVGSGPCGLFCALVMAEAGLRPMLIERGRDVDSRIQDVDKFFNTGEFSATSNVQFGEGGAGTFSDGKLYTVINDQRKKYIFEKLVEAGAPEEIMWDAHPHVGTDKLRAVVKKIREKIIALGGEVRFESCLTGIDIENEQIVAVTINEKDKINCDDVIVAIGHSARDTYEMLHASKVAMMAKPFAIGVRIEHLASMINKAQYGDYYNHPKLPTARYKLVAHVEGQRSVYTFCMCPGGYVVAAASEEGAVTTNGMSEFAQDGNNSNSALLVGVLPEDFGSDHPLAGIEFQRQWERKAFEIGGNNFHAPAQLLGDFLVDRPSTQAKVVEPTYKPGVKFTEIKECLPEFVTASLREAIDVLNKKIKGFSHRDAIITGVETRSSSPVRIIRDDSMQSNIKGLYPAGEGAGYAGGIVSSAVDGMKVAEMIIEKYL